MESMKIRVGKKVHLWVVLSLICYCAPLNHGCTPNEKNGCFSDDVPDAPLVVLSYPKEAIFQTMEVDGYLIDCVDIHRQPGLQHPLLVNHTIQLNPIFPTGTINQPLKTPYPLNLSRSCPEGSVPIEKLTIDPQAGLPTPFIDKHDRVLLRVPEHNMGARAEMNVWNPYTERPSERSLATILLLSEDGKTTLKAGWMVYPALYRNTSVRFFVAWGANGKGCFNFNCPGFIQTNRQHIANAMLHPVSQFSGDQREVTTQIYRDESGKWWVQRQDAVIGYWPREVVPAMEGGAVYADYGGEVVWDARGRPHTSTDMGSGRFPFLNYGQAAYFKNVKVFNPKMEWENPRDFFTYVENKECYDIQLGHLGNIGWGFYFYFGGPGRGPKCP